MSEPYNHRKRKTKMSAYFEMQAGAENAAISRRAALQLSALALGFAATRVWAFSLADITDAQAGSSLKTLLEKSATGAVLQLGRLDGFMGNDKVRIGLPGHLEQVGKLLRQLGQGQKVDDLVLAMNRGAEQAVPLAKPLLVNAVHSMTVVDAKNILTGGNTSVTDFFASKTRAPLTEKFLPIVTQTTNKSDLSGKYNRVAGKAAGLGLVSKEDSNIQGYVTRRALDGLFGVIGEQEAALRANPAKAGNELLSKVLGALRG